MNIDMSRTDAEIAAKLVATNYTDASLIHRDILGALMGQPGGPERYGRIFRIMNGLVDDPARQADYLLSAVYGFRNGSGLWDAGMVRGLIDIVYRLLPKVSEDARVELQRRCLYHLGLVQREVYVPDHFLHAAETHGRAAALAVNEAKRAIELVVAAVERLHHAIEINDANAFNTHLLVLGQLEEILSSVATSTGDAEAMKWLKADIPAHRFYACYLMGVPYSKSGTDLASLTGLTEPLASQYAVWIDICAGLNSVRITVADSYCSWQDREETFSIAEKVLARNGHPTHMGFGLLIAAIAHRDTGHRQLACELARFIVNYPTHGAHFVRTTAKCLFLERR
ncbi:MAG: hypothetical protein AAB849_00435 [Patescibacteria group bacterium]